MPRVDISAQRLGARVDQRQLAGEHGADMDEIGDRPALDQRQRRRAARHRLQRGGEPDDRLLLRREPGALARAQLLDDADARLGGGDVGLGGEDAGGDGGRLRARPRGIVGGAGGLQFERRRAALGQHRLPLGAGEGLRPRR